MNTKQKIIFELERKDFPNLEFLYGEEVLNVATKILDDFLEEERQDFKNKLKLKNENITFDTFNEESNLGYFWSLLNHLSNVNGSDKIREIIENFEHKLTEFSNEISYSKEYFKMLEYCLENTKLTEEQTKIIKDIIKSYKVRWINLEENKQEELKKISLKLSEIKTKFSNNVLDCEKEFEYFLENDEFLKEFPKSDLENAKSRAENKNKKWFLFDSSASSYISIMKYCSSSDIRKYFSDSFSSFASSWKYDNREIILEIINLQNKKAKLLNYNNYAELSLEFKMANSSDEVLNLLEELSNKAKPKALEEIEEIKEFFNLSKIESWDMWYYSRILKEKKYKLDDKKLKEYFEFENTKNALFETVKKLYDIKMNRIEVDWKYNENIEVYEVYKWNKFISYFMWDFFHNENKRSGAWADELRERFSDKKSIVINNMSFVKSKNSKTLLTLWEVTTMFHEFWHAIHSMLSKSEYSELTGFWVEWDFVELPSQILEKWAWEEETIINVAKHFETWEKLPEELLESLSKLKYFWTWSHVLGQNIYSIIDMMFYSWIEFKNVSDLDKQYLDKVNELSIFKKSENYKAYASFSHIFWGWYAAGYYSYMWADIIVDSIWEVFKEKWVYDKKTAKRFEEKILWAWSIKKASEMFEDFMWKWIEIEAFLKEKWLK